MFKNKSAWLTLLFSNYFQNGFKFLPSLSLRKKFSSQYYYNPDSSCGIFLNFKALTLCPIILMRLFFVSFKAIRQLTMVKLIKHVISRPWTTGINFKCIKIAFWHLKIPWLDLSFGFHPEQCAFNDKMHSLQEKSLKIKSTPTQ